MREGCSGTPADDALAPPLGASQWERTLFDHLTTHIAQERELLEEYIRAAAHTESKALAYSSIGSSTMSVAITACSCSLHYR